MSRYLGRRALAGHRDLLHRPPPRLVIFLPSTAGPQATQFLICFGGVPSSSTLRFSCKEISQSPASNSGNLTDQCNMQFHYPDSPPNCNFLVLQINPTGNWRGISLSFCKP